MWTAQDGSMADGETMNKFLAGSTPAAAVRRSQAGAADAAQPGRHQIRAGRIPSDPDRNRDAVSLRTAISRPLKTQNAARTHS